MLALYQGFRLRGFESLRARQVDLLEDAATSAEWISGRLRSFGYEADFPPASLWKSTASLTRISVTAYPRIALHGEGLQVTHTLEDPFHPSCTVRASK